MHTSLEIKDDMKKRIENLLSGTETISQFCFKATEAQVNRLEARSERARLQMMEKDKAIMEPVIMEVLRKHGII